MTEEKIPFLDMFPDAVIYADSCGGLDKAQVSGVTIVRETMTMVIRAFASCTRSGRFMIPPASSRNSTAALFPQHR